MKPSHTSRSRSIACSMSSTAFCPISVAGAANSPRKARFRWARHHSVKARSRSLPMVGLTTCACEPEPSLSRYWWTSNTVLFFGSCTFSIHTPFAPPYHSCSQVHAPVHPLPGTRIRFPAPVFRMAAMAAFAAFSHCSVGMSCGSFTNPNQTCRSFRNSRASRAQKSANTSNPTSGPPTTLPK